MIFGNVVLHHFLVSYSRKKFMINLSLISRGVQGRYQPKREIEVRDMRVQT
jgi:hypothetical protein